VLVEAEKLKKEKVQKRRKPAPFGMAVIVQRAMLVVVELLQSFVTFAFDDECAVEIVERRLEILLQQ
jgi:hypothetical protein